MGVLPEGMDGKIGNNTDGMGRNPLLHNDLCKYLRGKNMGAYYYIRPEFFYIGYKLFSKYGICKLANRHFDIVLFQFLCKPVHSPVKGWRKLGGN